MSDLSSVVLVHGACHGAWCWDRLTPALAARGVDARTVELPFTSLADDAATVAAAVDAAPGPVVVVGHSYGGSVVTAGGGGATHLVYVAALVPDPDQPIALAPTPGMSAITAGEDGQSFIDPAKAIPAFYHRCPPEDAEWAVTRLRPMPFATLASSGRPEKVAWRTVPSTYVLCSDDQVISPDDQRRMATRSVRCVEIDADHSPFFSRVDELADVLAETARLAGS